MTRAPGSVLAVLAIVLLASVVAAPGASARSTCTNEGTVVMVTVLGRNHYCEGSTCENHGLLLLVGRTDSCYGETYLYACEGSTCAGAYAPHMD